MKLSTKGRYGVRLMVDLALHYGEGPVLLKEIASRQEVSEKYLWQLVSPLMKAGLVESTRGAHGGYMLAKTPTTITLKDILYQLEGPVDVVGCMYDRTCCQNGENCRIQGIWCEIAAKMNNILEGYTLDIIADTHKEKFGYHIYHI